MVQEHFCSVLLNLPCNALHKITQTVNRMGQMTEVISSDTLGLPPTSAQCSHFSDSPRSTVSGSPRSWMVHPMGTDAYLVRKKKKSPIICTGFVSFVFYFILRFIYF